MDDTQKALFKHIIEQVMPLHKFLNVQLLEQGEGYAKLKMPFKSELVGDPRTQRWHGGMLSTLIDGTCGAAAITTMNGIEDRFATIDLRVDFLKPSGPKNLIAEAKIVRNGHRSIVTKCDVYHEGAPEEILAMGTVVLDVKRKSVNS